MPEEDVVERAREDEREGKSPSTHCRDTQNAWRANALHDRVRLPQGKQRAQGNVAAKGLQCLAAARRRSLPGRFGNL